MILNEFIIVFVNFNFLVFWIVVISVSDGIKVVVFFYISNLIVEEGVKREFGGGNVIVGGIFINFGCESIIFIFELLCVFYVMVKELKGYECEDFGVYLIGEDGKIIGFVDDNSSVI